MESRPTIEDVAKLAGVSSMTISRVLRNHPNVSDGTRARVMAAIKESGYRPNPLVSALMSDVRSRRHAQQFETMAFLIPSGDGEAWLRNRIYGRYFRGAAARCGDYGYKLDTFLTSSPELTKRRLSEILYARGIQGIVVGPVHGQSHGHLNINWEHYCSAAIGYSLLRPALHRSSNDQYYTMLDALRNARRYGYSRPGIVMPYGNDARVHYRWTAGFVTFCRKVLNTETCPTYLPRQIRRTTFFEWLKKERPDVILTTQRMTLDWLREEKYEIPGDIGFIHLDWTDDMEPCAGICQQPEKIGAAAVDLVIQQLHHNEFGVPETPRALLIQGYWVEGPTIRKQREGMVGRQKR